jgi:hypothetical protein
MRLFDTLRRRRDDGVQSPASDSGISSDMQPKGKQDILMVEKGLRRPESNSTQITENHTEDIHEQFINTDDPFPEVPGAPVEEQQLTVRAVLVGCMLGAVIAASNIYLGLKVRSTFWKEEPSSYPSNTDRVDVWRFFVRIDLRFRDPEAPVENRTIFPRRRLLRPQREQCLPVCCDVRRFSWTAIHIWVPRCLPARSTEYTSKRRPRSSHHVHNLLRLLWFNLYPAAEEILHPQTEACVSFWGRCSIHYSITPRRQER